MKSGQLANSRTGASMVVAGDRSTVLHGDYTETRERINYQINAQKVEYHFYGPSNGQIQDGGVKVKNEKDHVGKKKKNKKDFVGKKKNEKDHARVESQHSLKPSSDRSKGPESISIGGKREKSKDNPSEEINYCTRLILPQAPLREKSKDNPSEEINYCTRLILPQEVNSCTRLILPQGL